MRLPYILMRIDDSETYLTRLVISWWTLIHLYGSCNGYLVAVDTGRQPGESIFEAAVEGGVRQYRLDERRSPPYVKSLVQVHPRAGRLTLLEGLHCDNLYYPDTFTVYVESISDRLGNPEYYSMPVKVVVIGKDCDSDLGQDNLQFMQQEDTMVEHRTDNWNNPNPFYSPHGSSKVRLMMARRWVSESYASFAVPTASDLDIIPRLCLRRSQFVGSLADAFLPRVVRKNCTVEYRHISDPRFRIEKKNGDLVAADDVCISEPIWKVSILLSVSCPVDTANLTGLQDTSHRLKIAYRRQRLDVDADEMARRVRRELRNRSPFFEQPLYVAGVLEECSPPVAVITVKARDPENGLITYSMTSLLDSRTQAMFDIDGRTGLVSTRVQLDRELVDVHYFRVTATDDSFPPRSGTTMLQINVLDVNDHAPVFEMAEYEASIREGVGVGATVVTVKATDQDSGKNAEVEYILATVAGGGASTTAEDERAFKIDPKTGAITTRTALDRETAGVYTLVVQASDQASPQSARRTATATVVVKVLDDNDNYPQFLERAYAITLDEDIDVSNNPIIAQVTATDADQGTNAAVRYAIIGGNSQAQFAIDSTTGAVSLQKPLDYETARSYRLVVRAQDGGQPPRSNTTQLLVNVKDCNDNAPRFYASLFQESVLENVPVGYSVVKVQAYDADEGSNANIVYSLAQRDSQGGSTQDIPLAVDEHTGWICTTRELDREEHAKYMFQVIAADQGNPPQTAEASVAIIIQDVNDNDPVFSPKVYESVVSEADPPGTPVATVTASDPDEDGRLHYEITAGNQRGRFAITSQGGRGLVTIAQPLDYKQERCFVLTVLATDSGGRSDTATLYVNITDANNYAPAFENAPYTATVFEDAAVGTTVLLVSATDNDVGANAQITYSLDVGADEGNDPPPFTINAQTGAVVTLRQLDRETAAGYLLTVTAKDGGQPPLSDTTDVEIAVADVNDNYPVFNQPAYSASVAEDALVGTAVVQVVATDADAGLNGRVRYQLSEKDQQDGSFVIDPTSGVIRSNKGLDRESTASYELEAYAIDKGSPTLSSSVPVAIRIEDVNDSPPSFDSDRMVLYIAENSPIGSTVAELRAHDPDEGQNAAVQYSIVGGEDATSFSLVTRAGSDATAALVTMVELDYESAKKRYELIVRAASPPLRTDAHVDVLVTDVNDNAPQLSDFHVVFNNFQDCFPTGPVGRVPASDADVSDKLRYRILSGNNANLLALNGSTGELTLSHQLNTNVPRQASMEISVSDGVNEAKAIMQLQVRLVTDDMLFNSITVRLDRMTERAFLSPIMSYFVDALAAVIPCPKENIYLFSLQDDTDATSKVLNVSFSVAHVDGTGFYQPDFLRERVYLNRDMLTKLATVQILPFEDDLCVREPCLNYERCVTVLKFGNASAEFTASDTVLFRSIYPVTTFACRCPPGFTGSKEHYLCDTEVNLCYSSPCQNNGTCTVREGGYTCLCPEGYLGEQCEKDLKRERDTCKPNAPCSFDKDSANSCLPKPGRQNFICEECNILTDDEHYTPLCELKTRSFTKGAFLTFPSLKQRHRLTINLKFATQTQSGLLLYNGRYNERHDFLALEIWESDIRFSFSLGDEQVARVQAHVPGGVSDGKWHSVQLIYHNRTATIAIDNCDVRLALAHGKLLGDRWDCAARIEKQLESRCDRPQETCHRFLDLTGPLQIGGVPAGYSGEGQIGARHFDGCISEVKIDNRPLNLAAYVSDNGTALGCPQKRSRCGSRPCRNAGVCIDGWSAFRCQCPIGWGGRDCSDSIGAPWRFDGNGKLTFNPLLRPIQLPWINALSIRTLQSDAFLMSVQVGQNNTAVLSISKGRLRYAYDEESLVLDSSKPLNDGEWHRLEAAWLGTEIKLSVDYGDGGADTVPFNEKIQGMYIGKIVIGTPDQQQHEHKSYNGCVEDVRVGGGSMAASLLRPTSRESVTDGCPGLDPDGECPSEGGCPPFPAAVCQPKWGDRAKCECTAGHAGPLCQPVCELEPCDHGGRCVEDQLVPKGYRCDCNSTEYNGDYCDQARSQPCPAGWWGEPVCGPCKCDVLAGYNPDCEKKTGKCKCRENHYQPSISKSIRGSGLLEVCLPCDCYHLGSRGSQCDHETGQCRCREGVIGLKCDSCPNAYAEVTLDGCKVVYDGCPRSAAGGIWWPRTSFDSEATEACPKGAQGRASRRCDDKLGGWQHPDLFNCTSDRFVELREQLGNIKRGQLQVTTFVAIKLASDLRRAASDPKLVGRLYGADVLVTFELLRHLMEYERSRRGLDLSHSQDKDYVGDVVQSASVVLHEMYAEHWRRVRELTGEGPEDLVADIYRYLQVLADNQRDTYTTPFEIVVPDMVLGLDVVTPESVYGWEPVHPPPLHPGHTYSMESVVLPDTSLYWEQPYSNGPPSTIPSIVFPKYNNYLLNATKFDQHSRIAVPLSLLGIRKLDVGEVTATRHSLPEEGAVLSYAEYRRVGALFPAAFDDSVARRWGIDIMVASPLLSITILVPRYRDDNMALPPTLPLNEMDSKNQKEKRNMRGQRTRRERPVAYSSLLGVTLADPVRLQIWLDYNRTTINERSNPQCVHWTTLRGWGEWSRVGCRTELDDDWFDRSGYSPVTVNCTCNHLGTFAIIVDIVDLEYVPEPSFLEDASSYSCFSISLPLLLGTYLILALIRGPQTNSNTIRKQLVFCVFLAELLYFIALKAKRPMLSNEFYCKVCAIGLHYLWLAAFSWMLVDAIHLYRMLTEMRDVNHGPMRFYYSMGYALPALVVGLSVGVRAHQYGNYYFCWVSLYESVVWSLVGPICILVFINFIVLIFSIRAAFTVQDHVLGFGNLRTLLWVSVVSLPLLGATWTIALLDASERHPLLTPMLSVAVLIHAIFSLTGYCFANKRVRQNLLRSIMRCIGKKVPLLDTDSAVGAPSTSSQNVGHTTPHSRSALAYHSSLDANRRNLGISTSSTTSRSTTKTSSSPYRSDAHLRHTSTSTSNYNSASDVPSYLRGGAPQPASHHHRSRDIAGNPALGASHSCGSEEDSEGSEGRSLDLASSHSSDEDDASSGAQHHYGGRLSRHHGGSRHKSHDSGGRQHRNGNRPTVPTTGSTGYLPNITEHVGSRCGTPPSLNVVTNSQLFPNVQPVSCYGSRWSSQLPETYLSSANDAVRWSVNTESDNELCTGQIISKDNSPNPLPHPEYSDQQQRMQFGGQEQYVVQTGTPHYNSGVNVAIAQHYAAGKYHYSDEVFDDKHHDLDGGGNDKYLFPYTAEEDHVSTSPSEGAVQFQSQTMSDSRVVSPPGSKVSSVRASPATKQIPSAHHNNNSENSEETSV